MLHKRIGLLLIAAIMLGALAAPAHAQFGGIFGNNPPPRPPGAVPGPAPEPIYEDEEDVPDLPPQGRVLPAPNRGQPGVAPRPGAVQNQPLAPPPGTSVVPQDQVPGAPMQTAPGGVANTPGTLPGLPPGQRQPSRGTIPANVPANAPATLQPGDEVVSAPPVQKIANKQAVFSGLDKITGRIISFDADIGETVQFGALRVTPRACYTRPATEAANTDSFVEVDEITLKGEVKRIFGGWIFAASPGLHAIEHPIYDVWLTDCKAPEQVAATQPVSAPVPPPARTPTQAQPKRQPSAQQGQAPQQQPRPQTQQQRPPQQQQFPPGPSGLPPPVFAR
jgi:hypothetical protein